MTHLLGWVAGPAWLVGIVTFILLFGSWSFQPRGDEGPQLMLSLLNCKY